MLQNQEHILEMVEDDMSMSTRGIAAPVKCGSDYQKKIIILISINGYKAHKLNNILEEFHFDSGFWNSLIGMKIKLILSTDENSFTWNG